MFKLKNDELEMTISAHGAELKSVIKNEMEYLWQGNPEFWGRTSPILFPIVGSVAEGKYFVNGQVFELPQHGFARDMTFELISQADHAIWFKLTSTDETKLKYPFDFELRVGYELKKNEIHVYWEVDNLNDVIMPFSIGAHPALLAEPELDDYSLQMNANKNIETRFTDGGKGTLKMAPEKEVLIEGLPFLPLNKDFFEENPTLILEDENEILLRSYTHDREVEVTFDGFPYVGIWAPINVAGKLAPFVCIEPWYGVADTSTKPGELAEKTGIELLEVGKTFQATYKMTFK